MGSGSVYGRILRFLKLVDMDHCPAFASVEWFARPTYPCGGNPLVVRYVEDDGTVTSELGCILPITSIDPSHRPLSRLGGNWWWWVSHDEVRRNWYFDVIVHLFESVIFSSTIFGRKNSASIFWIWNSLTIYFSSIYFLVHENSSSMWIIHVIRLSIFNLVHLIFILVLPLVRLQKIVDLNLD